MDTVVNFRDLGGLKTRSGSYIKKHRLLRSGELVNISEEDKVLLVEGYNLRNIVDFRSNNEVKRSPDDTLDGVFYHNIDIMKNIENKASKKSFFKNRNSESIDPMVDIYRSIITNETACKGYREFIDVLLNNSEGSTIFHCFAGKDRTGIAAAIILTLLDVDEASIMDDYLLTNEMRKEANEEILRTMLKEGYSPFEVNKMATFLGVTSEYLETAYQEATDKFGSFSCFIMDGIGVSHEEIERLRLMYTEK
ncbi:hypothetical protein AOC36_03840 [Erysipelothrix larvae]|uniref:Tyrosine specific protein phosphatases domain-containing protein n=1 Tax=Erysipelothrix larvae TaxID=1514105 RepID=A0A109UGV2_9FIRM|nr:tyrosine-protein phosphatase [Erysipelothrix larvae]AMC93133.1 hypothetical protein AOC36_03840 [Erysipelothrix larvae]